MTVRMRLTLLYGGLFSVFGVALLGVTFLLVSTFSGHVTEISDELSPRDSATSGSPQPTLPPLSSRELEAQHAHDLEQLLLWSAVALAVMAGVSLVIAWWVAGRVLAPLRTMSAATRQISQDNLHARLALPGPSDELTDLADTIDDLLARLESSFEAQRRFVANASHELRTPLTRIRTALDVAVGKPGERPAELLSLDAKIRDGLDRADRLMEGLLALSRAEDGQLSDLCELRLDEAVSGALTEHETELGARGIRVEPVLEAVSVRASLILINRMLDNMIDNAARHGPDHSTLRVRVLTRDHHAVLTMDSEGEQLDAAAVAELAQPFRRLRTERTGSDNGAGLGLSIVAAIVSAHQGVLGLRARVEGGLRVTVELPAFESK